MTNDKDVIRIEKEAKARLEIIRAMNRWRDIDDYYAWMIAQLSHDKGTRKLTQPVFTALCNEDRGWHIRFDRQSAHLTVTIREPGTYNQNGIIYTTPISITHDKNLWTVDRLISLLERARPTRQLDWLSQAYNMVTVIATYQEQIDNAKAQMQTAFQAMVNPCADGDFLKHSTEWKRWPDEILAFYPDACPNK